MDRADRTTDSIQNSLNRRLTAIYREALNQALKQHKAFLQKIADVESGKIQPPAIYANDPDKIAKWKQGFLREAIRQQQIVQSIADKLAEAGVDAGAQIKDAMKRVYQVNNEYVKQVVTDAGINVRFSMLQQGQLDVLMQENESPFSKIAYKNLGSNVPVRKRLQREMALATILGEGQEKIVKRIMRVVDYSAYQARRVAQTERTRIQSQARWQAGEEAKDLGVEIENTWRTRMVNSRDTHIALNGKKAKQGEYFPGSMLRYPGDPSAPAGEVINCHCVLEPHVVRRSQNG